MEAKSLLDIKFKEMSIDEKREVFMLLDIVMKKYHENNYLITSFNPNDIYYEDGIFSFSNYERISPMNADDKTDAVLNNVISLADLAFCSYLPEYDISKGLLNTRAVSESYSKFENMFVPMDREYYRSVLVNSFQNRQLPDTPYYYDYISNKMKDADLSDRSNNNVISYVKATEAGRLMSDKDSEAAFGKTFFFATVAASAVLTTIGVILYFIK